MITPTRKRKIRQEVAMLLAEHGLDKITDAKTLLHYPMEHMSTHATFKKIFKNWGSLVASLKVSHPDLMEMAESKAKPAPKATPKPKAAAKPAAKSAVKKGK